MGLLNNKKAKSNADKDKSQSNNCLNSATSALSNASAQTLSNLSNYTSTSTNISTGGLWTYGNSGISTADSYFTVGSGIDMFELFISYFTEEEVKDFFNKIISRHTGENNSSIFGVSDVNNIISYVIRSRHFSEEFLLEFFEYVSVPDIMCRHRADIQSQQYSSLCLLIEGKKLC